MVTVLIRKFCGKAKVYQVHIGVLEALRNVDHDVVWLQVVVSDVGTVDKLVDAHQLMDHFENNLGSLFLLEMGKILFKPHFIEWHYIISVCF